MSVTYTPNLSIPRIDPDAPLLTEQFNDALDAIDAAATALAGITIGLADDEIQDLFN